MLFWDYGARLYAHQQLNSIKNFATHNLSVQLTIGTQACVNTALKEFYGFLGLFGSVFSTGTTTLPVPLLVSGATSGVVRAFWSTP